MESTRGRRRGLRRSDAQRRALVEAYRASGLSRAVFCRQAGISIGSLQRWGEALSAPESVAAGEMPWLDLGALEDRCAAVPALSGAFSGVELRLDLGGGVVVTIRRG